MSTPRKAEFRTPDLSDQAVCDYLQQNPDFFEQNIGLLDNLRLPHVTGGTVSLVERQVSLLRQKDLKMERQLKELLEVARSNDTLSDKLHSLTLGLLAASDFASTVDIIEHGLRAGFDAGESVLMLFGEPEDFPGGAPGRFFRVVQRDAPGLKAFDTFLEGASPRCGQVRDSQRDFLFGEQTNEIGSAALVPLGVEASTGLLAIGSADADRFHPGMSLDFLRKLGELITCALQRF